MLFALEAWGLIAFIYVGWNQWRPLFREQPLFCSLFLMAALTSLSHQLSGSEEIEFDGQQHLLVIRRRIFGWPRTRAYAFDELSGLEARDAPENNNPDGLRCRARRGIITFGRGVNSEQADRIIAELQRALPDASHQLLAGNDPFGKHFTTLKLT